MIEFELLIEELMLKLMEIDSSSNIHDPRQLTFKQVRETRYSNNKLPYNPAFRAHIGPKGKQLFLLGFIFVLNQTMNLFLVEGYLLIFLKMPLI